MKTSTKLGAGASLTFLLSSLMANGVVANAETVEGCGEMPEGVVLEKNGEYCQLIFGFGPGAAMEATWTVPEGVTSLQALLTGGGAGANDGGGEDFASGWGYSGAGGKVSYADLTSTPAGTELTVKVGAGGLTDAAGTGASVAGGTSEILGPDATSLALALGGQGTGGGGYCTPTNVTAPFVGVGIGAANIEDTDACDEFGAQGIVPGDDPNSPSLFKDLKGDAPDGGFQFGNGGILSDSEANVFGPGWGAWVKGNSDGSVTAATSGQPGVVIIRYILEEVPAENETGGEELADTGASEEQVSTLAQAAAMIAGLGTMLVLSSRRRKNRA